MRVAPKVRKIRELHRGPDAKLAWRDGAAFALPKRRVPQFAAAGARTGANYARTTSPLISETSAPSRDVSRERVRIAVWRLGGRLPTVTDADVDNALPSIPLVLTCFSREKPERGTQQLAADV